MTSMNPKEKGLICLVVVCAACIVFTLAVILCFAISFSESNAVIHATGKNDVNFKVYYLENEVFEGGAIPSGCSYLMSFTDYLEIENSFSAEFSQEYDISYHYTATETLVIKSQKGSDYNINPVVYEKKSSLSEKNGNVTGERISFKGADAGEPGGIYVIDPRKHIDTYRQFVDVQYSKMHDGNVPIESKQGFSAELLVDFVYNIRISENGINETVTRGYQIPLSDEVFNFIETGTSQFEVSSSANKNKMPELPVMSLLVIWFAALGLGICFGIRQLTIEKDEHLRMLKHILKKYSDEIIISADPVDLTEYKTISVLQFHELLKLAVNSSKHILCYRNDGKAEFCVITDGYAYCFKLPGLSGENHSRVEKEVHDDAADLFIEERIAISEINDIASEANKIFAVIDSFVTKSVSINKSLSPHIESINRCNDEPPEECFLKKLYAYKNMVDVIQNNMSEMPLSWQAEMTGFLAKLDDFRLYLESFISITEESVRLLI